MSTSNVRSIESLEELRVAMFDLASQWDGACGEVRQVIHRVLEHFREERPAYWRHQTRLAERELAEAKDNLSRMRAEIRPGDAPPATEAAQRVILAERRLRLCEEKMRLAKKWSIDISGRCDELLGPLANVAEQCQTSLPGAAVDLGRLIDQLRLYADQPAPPPE